MIPKINSYALQKELLIVAAAVRTGLFDALKNEPMSLEGLSHKTHTDKRALWIVTEALAALGYLYYKESKLNLTKEAYAIFYDKDSEEYSDFSFMHRYNLIATWMRLPEALRSGKPVTGLEKTDKTKDYILAMKHYAKDSAADIARYCLRGLPKRAKVLDVGGGPLTNAAAFIQKGAEVTVLDLPDVIDMMAADLDSKMPVTMIKGDFTKGLPKGPFDLVYLGNVCHLYGEDVNRTLFRNAYDVLKNEAKIVIKDMIRGAGPEPALFAVNMLLHSPDGGTWTFEQYAAWLSDAGFSDPKFEMVNDSQLVSALKR
jgi:SAM-dependent methyltransferase